VEAAEAMTAEQSLQLVQRLFEDVEVPGAHVELKRGTELSGVNTVSLKNMTLSHIVTLCPQC
jgi:hypothetical protein